MRSGSTVSPSRSVARRRCRRRESRSRSRCRFRQREDGAAFRCGASAPQFGGQGGNGRWSRGASDGRVNVSALRDMTDDSGGRTEIIRSARDLDPATVGIADELSKQYYLGYQSTGKRDGRWHSIRVELKNSSYRVRARRGYTAN